MGASEGVGTSSGRLAPCDARGLLARVGAGPQVPGRGACVSERDRATLRSLRKRLEASRTQAVTAGRLLERIFVAGETGRRWRRGSWWPCPSTGSHHVPACLLQRIRQLVSPAEDLPPWNREAGSPATPRTSLLMLTERESHC